MLKGDVYFVVGKVMLLKRWTKDTFDVLWINKGIYPGRRD